MRILPTVILALAACCAGAASATDVYRWTDEKGVTHYSDTPPGNKKYERVNVRTGKASEPVQELQQEAPPKPTAPARATAQVDPAVRAERCQNARRNLIALRSNLDVTAEFDGETRTLTPEERATQLEQNEKIVSANCDNE